jgi:hypothetical protein
VTFLVERDGEVLADALRELRSSGELSGYTDDELMTVNLVAIWKKAVLVCIGAVPGLR